jgi:hypothetical protein
MFYKKKMMFKDLVDRGRLYSYSREYPDSFRGYKVYYLNPFEDIVRQCMNRLNDYGTFNIRKNNIILINICRLKTYLPELFDFELPTDPLQYQPILVLTLTPAYVLLRFGSISENFTIYIYPDNNQYGIKYEGLRFPGYQKIEDIVNFVKENNIE